MKYPYDTHYEPPFPTVQVILDNIEDGEKTGRLPGLLDTGADGSMVPVDVLRQILAPAISESRIRSHWGEWRSVQLFVVDIVIDGLRLPGVWVVGDEQGDEIVLGRNVINMLRILLDGPANQTDVSAS
jgi:predicted aspartyl protease